MIHRIVFRVATRNLVVIHLKILCELSESLIIAGAIILRVVLVAFAVTLLQIPFLKLVGAILLIWIGYKLIAQQDENQHTLQGPNQLFAAIKTIIVADIVMSLDNVLAIAGAAGQVSNPSHQVGYVILA